MASGVPGVQLRRLLFGTKVDRPTGTLPATATGSLFTVSGGRVLITSITGVVTVAIQAQANAVKLVATPTVGTVNNLSATVDINGAAVGALLAPLGLAADALVLSTGGGISGLRNPITVAAGAIGLNTAATNTGSIAWSLTYVPLDDGAVVTAA